MPAFLNNLLGVVYLRETWVWQAVCFRCLEFNRHLHGRKGLNQIWQIRQRHCTLPVSSVSWGGGGAGKCVRSEWVRFYGS